MFPRTLLLCREGGRPVWVSAFAGEQSLGADKRDETIGRAVVFGGVILTRDLMPAIEGGHGRVAFGGGVDFGQFDKVSVGEELRVDLGPANDGHILACRCQRFFYRVRDFRTVRLPVAAREDDVAAAGEGAGKLSKVLRPITIGFPIVNALKRLRSAGRRQGSCPSRPMTPLVARAR